MMGEAWGLYTIFFGMGAIEQPRPRPEHFDAGNLRWKVNKQLQQAMQAWWFVKVDGQKNMICFPMFLIPGPPEKPAKHCTHPRTYPRCWINYTFVPGLICLFLSTPVQDLPKALQNAVSNDVSRIWDHLLSKWCKDMTDVDVGCMHQSPWMHHTCGIHFCNLPSWNVLLLSCLFPGDLYIYIYTYVLSNFTSPWIFGKQWICSFIIACMEFGDLVGGH